MLNQDRQRGGEQRAGAKGRCPFSAAGARWSTAVLSDPSGPKHFVSNARGEGAFGRRPPGPRSVRTPKLRSFRAVPNQSGSIRTAQVDPAKPSCAIDSNEFGHGPDLKPEPGPKPTRTDPNRAAPSQRGREPGQEAARCENLGRRALDNPYTSCGPQQPPRPDRGGHNQPKISQLIQAV